MTTEYNYYKLLEVSPDASTEEIKKAYREKAKLYHPDVNDHENAEKLFMLINEAHEVLTDENKRYLFDLKMKYSGQRKKRHARDFHYDWDSFRKAAPRRKEPTIHPFIYNLFFASGMFIGFNITIIFLWLTAYNYIPKIFGLMMIPGIILIRDGWNGITGRKSGLRKFLKALRKFFTRA